MRAQASLEFLLILSIISGLSMFAISSYSSTIGKSSQLLLPFTTINPYQSANLSPLKEQSMGIAFYLPTNSTIGKSEPLQVGAYGCDNGTVLARLSSSGLELSKNEISFGVSGVDFGNAYFSPISSGYNKIYINYTYQCGSTLRSGNLNLTTYSTQQQSSSESSTSFSLSPQNENIIYPLLNDGNVLGLTEFSHCTYASMFGPAGINGQCGTTDAWEYSVFSNYCYSSSNYYTVTYCIVPYAIKYTILHPDTTNYKYNYSFGLDIFSQGLDAKANFLNANSSNLTLNGKEIGHTAIQKISVSSGLQNMNLIRSPNSSGKISDQVYSSYTQAKNNLYASLQFYNNSMVSSDVQSSLESSILAYSKSVNNLLNSSPEVYSQCIMKNLTYVCSPPTPFYYNLIANISSSRFQNSTLSYQGSTLKINET